MTHRGGWGCVIAVLDKYISLRNDWPISSPLGRLNDGGADDVNRDISGRLAWLADIGACLARLTTDERETVLEVAMLRRAEREAVSMAKNADLAGRRSGEVSDVRHVPRKAKEWREVASEHQRQRRKIEERKPYQRGMDRLSILVAEVR